MDSVLLSRSVELWTGATQWHREPTGHSHSPTMTLLHYPIDSKTGNYRSMCDVLRYQKL